MDANKIGAFIKELRSELNMTQKDLACAINCTDKAISRWETGRGIPEVSMLIPLSKTLGVSVNELLMGERFNLVSSQTAEEKSAEAISVPEIINKSDEAVSYVITQSDMEIKKINKGKWVFMCLFCIQLLIFFVIPNFWIRDSTEILVYGSALNAFAAGLIGDKIKWSFPLFGGIITIASVFSGSGEEIMGLVFAFYFAAAAAVIMAVSSGIKFAVSALVKKVR